MPALYFPLHGYEFNKIAWPAAADADYTFEALDLQEYSGANLVFVRSSGATALTVDIGWSSTGDPSDQHSVTTDVIDATGASLSVNLSRRGEDAASDQYLIRDRFLHVTASQATTAEDAWIYISGVS